MLIKNSLKRKISSFILCLITVVIGIFFLYFTVKNYAKCFPFYIVIIGFVYLEYIFIKNFIAITANYQIKNDIFSIGKKEVKKENIKSLDIIKDEKENDVYYSLKTNIEILIENNKNSDLENYIKNVIDYRENEFSKKEKNILFNKKIIFFLIYENALLISILISIANIKNINEFCLLHYLLLFFVGFIFVKSILNICYYKNSYFNNKELYIKNKHILYNEIVSIRKIKNTRTGTENIIIETDDKKITIPKIYLHFDSIVENYINKKIHEST